MGKRILLIWFAVSILIFMSSCGDDSESDEVKEGNNLLSQFDGNYTSGCLYSNGTSVISKMSIKNSTITIHSAKFYGIGCKEVNLIQKVSTKENVESKGSYKGATVIKINVESVK